MNAFKLNILIQLFALQTFAQQICKCPVNTIAGNQSMPNKIFNFSNGNVIGICGYVENDSIFSEFVVYDCGSKAIYGEWSATEACTIKKINDTLIVYKQFYLPTGKDLEFRYSPFGATSFYYRNDSLIKEQYYFNAYTKYSSKKIDAINASYKLSSRGANNDSTLLLAYMLFWSYVSGSTEAEKNLQSFKARYGPFDGCISEEWNEIINTYYHYKDLQKNRKF